MNKGLIDIDILSIAKEASSKKKKDHKVINAALGILTDEEGTFLTLKSVSEAIDDVDKEVLRMYMPVDGGELYKRSLYHYLFKSHLDELFKTYHVASNWSSGGSGALYMAFKLHEGKILLPSIRWNEYDQIAKSVSKEIIVYDLFKENHLNIESIKEHVQSTKESILLVLNDPAHNPTGYSMGLEEYEVLLKILKENPHVKLILDIAYFEFGDEYFKKVLPLFLEYKVSFQIAFSGSKSFLVYGVRMGSLIDLSVDVESTTPFITKSALLGQTMYGAPNSLSVLLLSSIIYKSNLHNEQLKLKHLLKERSELFLSLCREYHIKTYPYKEGFFITVVCEDSLKLSQQLKEKSIYVVPTYKGIRIAISSISLEEIKRCVKQLRKVL